MGVGSPSREPRSMVVKEVQKETEERLTLDRVNDAVQENQMSNSEYADVMGSF